MISFDFFGEPSLFKYKPSSLLLLLVAYARRGKSAVTGF